MQVQVIPGAVGMLYSHAEDLIPDDLREDGECDCVGPCCRSHVQEGEFSLECIASHDETDAIRKRVKTLRALARAEGIDPDTLPIDAILRGVEHLDFVTHPLREAVSDPLDLLIESSERDERFAESLTDALFARVFGSSERRDHEEEVSCVPLRPTAGRVWIKTDSGYVLRS